jgi:SAM-dependent methyltransferase
MTADDSGTPLTQPVKREFDSYAEAYERLLSDPLRDGFSSGETGSFHRRKRDVISARFARRGVDTKRWKYLDLGCGRGELVRLLSPEFAISAGCDTSKEMLREGDPDQMVFQDDALRLPFEDGGFDFVTAVCVYHHVPPLDRAALTLEVYRVLRPGGSFCVIEHNPFNPVTRLIVARSPVDVDAHLLSHRRMRVLMQDGGFDPEETSFFMYLPEMVYRWASGLEDALKWLPLGGQYAVFCRRPVARAFGP